MLDIEKISTHHWLSFRHEKHFHAYIRGHKGEFSLCKLIAPIVDVKKMNIPGDRSPCCIHCFNALYGIRLSGEFVKDLL